VQFPGGLGTSSGGDRDMAVALSRAAVACGVDGVFLEVHPRPESALCDGPNSLSLDMLPRLLGVLKDIDAITRKDIT
ncbi:MAG: 3-deoxy-8-phosphooctulonate synthase, partial [Syntrophales bacterium]|nr:3-deoxy-8-phosphooctulonate synthase [Syntrophales bacterium]